MLNLTRILDKTFRVVAVGIGDNVDESALNLMASLPSDDNTHKISSWDNLPDIAQEVAYDVCQVQLTYRYGLKAVLKDKFS